MVSRTSSSECRRPSRSGPSRTRAGPRPGRVPPPTAGPGRRADRGGTPRRPARWPAPGPGCAGWPDGRRRSRRSRRAAARCAGSWIGAAAHVQRCTGRLKCSVAKICSAWSTASAVPGRVGAGVRLVPAGAGHEVHRRGAAQHRGGRPRPRAAGRARRRPPGCGRRPRPGRPAGPGRSACTRASGCAARYASSSLSPRSIGAVLSAPMKRRRPPPRVGDHRAHRCGPVGRRSRTARGRGRPGGSARRDRRRGQGEPRVHRQHLQTPIVTRVTASDNSLYAPGRAAVAPYRRRSPRRAGRPALPGGRPRRVRRRRPPWPAWTSPTPRTATGWPRPSSCSNTADLSVRDTAVVRGRPAFPYVPGLFAFREVPALLDALERLTVRPDVLICDGHGLAHPRRFGLAAHLGRAHRPARRSASGKTRLVGDWEPVGDQRGRPIGAGRRGRDGRRGAAYPDRGEAGLRLRRAPDRPGHAPAR